MPRKAKKNLKYFLISSYYLFLLGLALFKIIQTVYAGSLYLASNYQLQELEKNNQNLILEQNQLKTQLAAQNSLQNLKNNDLLQDYSPAQPIIIDQNHQLAWRD